MPRDFFRTVTDPSRTVGTRKWYTVPLSLAAHALAVLALVIVPLLATDSLPIPESGIVFVPVVAAPVPPAPPPPAPRVDRVREPAANRHAAPVEAPDAITVESDVQAGFEETIEGGTGIEALGVLEGSRALIAPPAPPSPAPAPPAKVRAGVGVQPPAKIVDVAPVYPPVAQAARVEGVVVIEATIGVDGRVQDARVLRSAPLLDAAALSAVRQWVYTPTRLHGAPVAVVMTVTVRFQLK